MVSHLFVHSAKQNEFVCGPFSENCLKRCKTSQRTNCCWYFWRYFWKEPWAYVYVTILYRLRALEAAKWRAVISMRLHLYTAVLGFYSTVFTCYTWNSASVHVPIGVIFPGCSTCQSACPNVNVSACLNYSVILQGLRCHPFWTKCVYLPVSN